MLRSAVPWVVLSVGLLFCACSSKSTDAKADKAAKPTEARTVAVAVAPETFECDSVAPLDKLKALLGENVQRTDSHFRPPRGVPRPCAYTRTIEEKEQRWSFDLDCRETAHKTAADMMKQYAASAQGASTAAQKYNEEVTKAQKAGIAGDAGVAKEIAETASLDDIGKKAVDLHGVALLVIDDDTPCHVRVLGPEAEGRRAIAALVAKRLTTKTAPIVVHKGKKSKKRRSASKR